MAAKAVSAAKAILISIILLSCFSAIASSQGYMGTVSTGTGIIPALTVGKGSASTSELGAASTLANLTGSWSLDLAGSSLRHIDLQIRQKGDFIMGSGIMSSGDRTVSVIAAGSVAASSPSLFVSSVDGLESLRLSLSTSGTTLAGEYDLLSADGSSGSGTVTASLVLAEGEGNALALGKGSSPSATSGAWVGSAVQNIAEQNQ